MTATAQAELEQVMQLSTEEREWIAECVCMHSDAPQDPSIEQAWRVEVERRIADIDSGRVQMVPHEEAMRRIRTAANEAATAEGSRTCRSSVLP